MNIAMAHSNPGRDRKTGYVPHGRIFWPSVCLIAMLPLLAACDSLLETAGLAREPAQEAVMPLPDAAINNPVAEPRPRNMPPAGWADSPKIAEIQKMLTKLGYDPGPADGIMGQHTKAAIQQFQAAADMPVDGKASPALRSALQREINVRMGMAEPPTGESGARVIKVALPARGGRGETDTAGLWKIPGPDKGSFMPADVLAS